MTVKGDRKCRVRVFLALAMAMAGALAVSTVRAEWADIIADVSLELLHTDNLNQSAFNADMESDTGIVPRLSLGRYYQANDLTRVRLTVDLSAEHYDEFDKLDSVTAMAGVVLQHKFGIGPQKPWLRAGLAFGRKDAEVGIRDSDLIEASLRTGKRLSERMDGSLGFRYFRRDGGTGVAIEPGIGGNVFDINNWSVDGTLNYLLTDKSLLSATYTYRNGEFDSACTPGNVGTVLANENVRAITLDDVFGGCVYRLDGNSDSLYVNYGYALGHHAALNAGIEYRNGKADVLGYETTIFRISLNYSY